MLDRLNLATVILSGTVLVSSTLAPNSASVAVELGAGTAIIPGSCMAFEGSRFDIGTNITTFPRGVGQFKHVDVKVNRGPSGRQWVTQELEAQIVRNGVVVDSNSRGPDGSGFTRIPSGPNAKFRKGDNVDVKVSYSLINVGDPTDPASPTFPIDVISCTIDLGNIPF